MAQNYDSSRALFVDYDIAPLFFDFVAKHFAAQRPRDEKQSLGRGKGERGDKGKRTKTKERERPREEGRIGNAGNGREKERAGETRQKRICL